MSKLRHQIEYLSNKILAAEDRIEKLQRDMQAIMRRVGIPGPKSTPIEQMVEWLEESHAGAKHGVFIDLENTLRKAKELRDGDG
jgi:hypothetical protein